MKYFFVGFILVLIPVAGFNFYIDVENNYWRYKQFPTVAIPPDKALIVPANRKERDDRVAFLKQVKIGKYLVMGSSRSIRWGSPETDLQDLTNISVATLSMIELAALYEAMLESGNLPNHLILSLDPWMLNENAGGDDSEWLNRSGFFYRFKLRVLKDKTKPYLNILKKQIDSYQDFCEDIISFDRLLASIKYIKKFGWNLGHFYYLEDLRHVSESSYALRSDGVLIYPKFLDSKSQDEVDEAGRTNPDPSQDYVFKDFTVSSEKWIVLQALIKDAKEKGLKVTVLSTPFHPFTYERLTTMPMYKEAMAQWQKTLIQTAELTKTCDLTDPKVAGCSKSEFMDSSHMKIACIRKIFQACKVD